MIILCEPGRDLLGQIERCLAEQVPVHQVQTTGELAPTLAERNGQTQVVVLGPGLTRSAALEAADQVQEHDPNLPVVMIADTVSRELLQSAMRAGIRDVISEPLDEAELKSALVRALGLVQRGREKGEEAPHGGKVVTVFSTKGGCGKSVVATNLAVLLAQDTGEEVCLVDLDLQSGDLALMLQLLPAYTMHDVVEQIHNLDAEAMRGYLTTHRSGVSLLTAPTEPAQAESIGAQDATAILELLREMFPYVVIDSPPAFTDTVLAALDETDETVLLTSMDVPSIKNLKMGLQTLEQLGIPRDRIDVVLNRADSKVGLRLEEVEKAVGTSVDIAVPSSRDVPLSVNQGIPLAIGDRKSAVTSALAELAKRVGASEAVSDGGSGKRTKRGLFSRN